MRETRFWPNAIWPVVALIIFAATMYAEYSIFDAGGLVKIYTVLLSGIFGIPFLIAEDKLAFLKALLP